MSKKTTSQWDFGELFPPEQTRRVLTVSALTTNVRRLLEKEIGEIWITGELTNLRAQSSGHIYFTLKDGGAQLSCVLFRNEAAAHREFLEDGQKVLLQGALTVYEARGQYQLIVRAIEPQGVGALQLAFEKLKRRLQAAGLFATERKRALPRYPRRLGLVTSPTGAAIRDVLHVIGRRQPALEIVLVPCRVQGAGAAAELAAAIRLLNSWSAGRGETERLDLILVTRGGGSLEDLWAFNEEQVAQAIFESELPVVSAVGHEIDFTISDFVADVRAATPSVAAEIITEGSFASRRNVAQAARRLGPLVRARLESDRDALAQLSQRLARVHPRRQWREQLQHLDELQDALGRCVRQGWREQRTAWLNLQQRLSRLKPSVVLSLRRQQLLQWDRRLRAQAVRQGQAARGAFATLEARLRLLSPENVLARGYSITRDAASGRIIRAAAETHGGQTLSTRLQSGEVRSVVVVHPEVAGHV